VKKILAGISGKRPSTDRLPLALGLRDVGEATQIEREHLLPLAAQGSSCPVVDSKGCVKVRTNCDSTARSWARAHR